MFTFVCCFPFIQKIDSFWDINPDQAVIVSRTLVDWKNKWVVGGFDPVKVLFIGTFGLSFPQATDWANLTNLNYIIYVRFS